RPAPGTPPAPAAFFFSPPGQGHASRASPPPPWQKRICDGGRQLLMTGSPARRATNRKRLVKEVLGTSIGTIVNSGGFEVVNGTASGTTVGAGRLLVWHHDS